jgi:hypothetical protein
MTLRPSRRIREAGSRFASRERRTHAPPVGPGSSLSARRRASARSAGPRRAIRRRPRRRAGVGEATFSPRRQRSQLVPIRSTPPWPFASCGMGSQGPGVPRVSGGPVAGSRRDVAGPRKGWESGNPRSKDHQALRKRGVHPATARRLAAGGDDGRKAHPKPRPGVCGRGAGRRRDLRGRRCAAGGRSARSERISHAVGRRQAHVGRADPVLPQRTGNTLTSGCLSADCCEALCHRRRPGHRERRENGVRPARANAPARLLSARPTRADRQEATTSPSSPRRSPFRRRRRRDRGPSPR